MNKFDRQNRHSLPMIDKQTLLLREVSILVGFVSRENRPRSTESSAGSRVDTNKMLCKITVMWQARAEVRSPFILEAEAWAIFWEESFSQHQVVQDSWVFKFTYCLTNFSFCSLRSGYPFWSLLCTMFSLLFLLCNNCLLVIANPLNPLSICQLFIDPSGDNQKRRFHSENAWIFFRPHCARELN